MDKNLDRTARWLEGSILRPSRKVVRRKLELADGLVARTENSATNRTANAALGIARQVSGRSRPSGGKNNRAMSRIPGLLGERIIRRLIRQLSMTLSPK